MRRSLLLLGAIFLASGSAASADSKTQKPPARLIEATVTSDGQVVPVQAAVEKLNDGAGARGVSPCGPPINMDAATGRGLVLKVAQEEGFYPEFVLAVAHAESQFDPNAISPRGAIGLMQLEPATADRYKVEICDPADNVRGGVRFLRDLHARYKNPLFILAAYNAGEEYLLQYHGVPPFPETVRFVATVVNEFYDWPAPVPKNQPAAASKGRGPKPAPSFKEASPSNEANDNRWQSGFVWNVE
jgi:soluble lytic murein transglycosylase-like protein